MKKKAIWLCGVLALILLISGASILYNRMSGEATLPPVTTAAPEETTDTEENIVEPVAAPDFTVIDPEGNSVSLSDLKGKPVIINFWASWCSPCKSEMPDFDTAFQLYGEEIQFMMINLTDGNRETVDGAKAFISDSGYTFPPFFDTELSAAIAYRVSSIPATYFVNADGNLIAYGIGPLDLNALETGIDMLHKSKQP
jgi:thiol-disulfide isomerase/thioredoxin